jgi:ParB family transcriptional regulator, chromosome partitioning protein
MTKNKIEKRTLGRGLSSLLPDNPVDEERKDFAFIDINKIKPNPFQPRQTIPLASVMELSDSIKEKGVMQPLVVVKDKQGDGYILVAGERRLQASKLAEIKEVPALIKELDDKQMAEMAIVENIHRKDLNPMEEGFAFLRLNKEFKMSFEEIAQKIAKNAAYVENKIRLTRLPKLIQNAIAVAEITEAHGRALLGLNDEEAMIAALKIIIRNGLNSQRTEELVRQIKAETLANKRTIGSNPTLEWEQKYNYIRDDFNKDMGIDVKLKRNKKHGGAILINFNSDDELVSIYRKLTGKEQQ